MRDPAGVRMYRWLQALYPAGFRERYGSAMERDFRDDLREARGGRETAWVWLRLLWDLARTVPAQMVTEFRQDGQHAVRLWARHPMETALAIAALAIGIGANLGVFSVVNALLLRPLPFAEADRLGVLRDIDFIPPHDSARQFHDWRTASSYLADAALVEDGNVNLGKPGLFLRGHAAITTWNFFRTMGVQPLRGRTFAEGEDTEGRTRVAVISHGLWMQMFGGDAGAANQQIDIDGVPHTIIGVAPAGFDYPRGTMVWRPAVLKPGNNGWSTLCRLRAGLSWEQARAAFALDVDRNTERDSGGSARRPQLRTLREGLAGQAGNASLIVLAGAGLLLLIACANVANLLLARTADRSGELSIRSALGASRARLMQQLFTECLLVCGVAAVAGAGVAWSIVTIATRLQPPPILSQSYTLWDERIGLFAAALCLASGVLFGVLPAALAGRTHRLGMRGAVRGDGTRHWREMLAVAQIVITVVLLTASVSLGRAFRTLMREERGYDVRQVVTVNVSLEGTAWQQNKRQMAYFAEALERVRRLPGVRSASLTEFLPLYADGFLGGPFGVDGRRGPRGATMIPVMEQYFETMGAPLLAGREITAAEVREGSKVAVVNERFAAMFGGAPEVVGHQLTIGKRAWKIVGVARGMEYETDRTLARGTQVFVPSSTPGGFFTTIVARVDGKAEDSVAVVREAVRAVDAGAAVFGASTMAQRLEDTFAKPRGYQTAAWLFAGFALSLGLIGLYGIVSYGVARRQREMGIRLALGTTPANLRRLQLRRGVTLAGAGVVPGVMLARGAASALGHLVPGAGVADAVTMAGVGVFVVAATAASVWMATRQIARIEVAEVLNSE